MLLPDVDHFKDVNDLRGHAVGDAVMTTEDRTVGACLPDGALLGRLGGDEFAVVVPGAGADAGFTSADPARSPNSGTPPASRVKVERGLSLGPWGL